MQNQLLLLDDVDNVGRSGDVVTVRPGFARNFLLPQKKAVVADKFTLRMQARLKDERLKRAEIDKKEAAILAERISPMELVIVTKVDPDGRMYGSVSALDIIRLFEKEEIVLEKKHVVLLHPIKDLGVHKIQLKLKEGVTTSFILKIESDVPLPAKKVEEEPVAIEEEIEIPPSE